MWHKPTEVLEPLAHPYLGQEMGGRVKWELTSGDPGQLLAEHRLIFTSSASNVGAFQNEVPPS